MTGLRMPTQMMILVTTETIANNARTAPLVVPPMSHPRTKKPCDSVTRTENESEPDTRPASLMALTVSTAVVGRGPVIGEGVARLHTGSPLLRLAGHRGRPVAKVPLILVVPKLRVAEERRAVVLLVALLHRPVLSGEHLDGGHVADRRLQGVGTLSEPTLTRGGQVYRHDVR